MSTEKPPIQIEDGTPLPKSRGGFKGFAETADIYAAVCALKPASRFWSIPQGCTGV